MLSKFFCALLAIFAIFLTSVKVSAYPLNPLPYQHWYFDDGQHGHGYSEPFLHVGTPNVGIYFSNVPSIERGLDIETQNESLDDIQAPGCPHHKVTIIFSDGENINLRHGFGCWWLYGESSNDQSTMTHHSDEEHYIYDKLIIKRIRPVAIDYDNHRGIINGIDFDKSLDLFVKITDPRKYPKLYNMSNFPDTNTFSADDPFH